MLYYKLTDKDGYTRKDANNECLWGDNITHTATGKESQLCSSDLIHVYQHPLIASLMNPVHADFKNPLLWECEVTGNCAHDGQLKSGFKTVTTIRRIDLPVITLEQRIRIAIYCSLKKYSDPSFVKWANAWLDGSDRSEDSAEAAEEASAAWAAWAAEARAEAKAWAEEFDLLTIIKSVVEEGK